MSPASFVRIFRRTQTVAKRLTKNIAETNCPVQRAQLYDTLLRVNSQLEEMQDILVRAFNNYSQIDFNLLKISPPEQHLNLPPIL